MRNSSTYPPYTHTWARLLALMVMGFWLLYSQSLFATGCPGLQIQYVGSNDTIAAGGSATFEAQLTSGSGTIVWNFGSGALPASATGPGPHTVMFPAGGSRTISASLTPDPMQHPGCSLVSQSLGLTVLNCANFSNGITAPQVVNANDSFTVVNGSTNQTAAAQYIWDFDGALVLSGSGAGPYQLAFTTPGNYTLTCQVAQYGCTTAVVSRNILVNIACAAPTNVVSGTLTANTAALSWDPVAGNQGYFVYWRTPGSPNWQLQQTPAGTNSLIISPLTASTTYEAEVRTVCAPTVRSLPSNRIMFTSTSVPSTCTQPTSLTLVSLNTTSLTADWNAQPGVQFYLAYIKQVGGTFFRQANVFGTSHSYTFTGLQPGTQYEVGVYSGCTGGIRSLTTINTGFTTAPPPFCNVVNANLVSPTDTVGTGVSVQFVGSSNAASGTYSWVFGTGALPSNAMGQGPHTVSYTSQGNKLAVLTFQPDTNLYPGCKPITATVPLFVINCGQFTNTLFAPTSPVNATDSFTVLNTGANHTAAAQYNWNFGGATVLSGSGRGPYRLSFATPGNYSISCFVTQYGCTTATTTSNITVNQACAAPTNVTFSNITANSAFVNWNAMMGSNGYFILWRPVGQTGWSSTQVSAAVTTAPISPLVANTSYEVQVRSICAPGVLSKLAAPALLMTNNDPPTCAAPVTLSQTGSTPNSVTMSWTAVPGASGYVIHIRPSGTTFYQPFNVAGGATTRTLTGLLPGTAYDVMMYTGCSGIRSTNFTVMANTATLKTSPAGAEVILFPNPVAQDHFTVRSPQLAEGERVHLEILDVTGRVVYATQLMPIDGMLDARVPSPAQAGTYLVKLTGAVQATQRLVVTR